MKKKDRRKKREQEAQEAKAQKIKNAELTKMRNFIIKCDAVKGKEEINKYIAKAKKYIEDNSLMKDQSLNDDVSEIKRLSLFGALGNLYNKLSDASQEKASDWRGGSYPRNLAHSINYFRDVSYIFLNNSSKNMKNLSQENLQEAYNHINLSLANNLSRQKRLVETLSKKIGTSTLAVENKIRRMFSIADYLIDKTDRYFYYNKCMLLIDKFCKNSTVPENIESPKMTNFYDGDLSFEEYFNNKKYYFELLNKYRQKKYSKSDSYESDEKEYRDWCLKECLFINHRNDITTEWIADGDTLNFPSYNPEGKSPSLADAFSDLKKEYCFARHLAYEGVDQMQRSYEGNKDDGYIEKMKTALRVSFSSLDSIVSIMCNYFKYDHKSKPCFKPKWFFNNLSKTEENPFIDALYWLSCDLFYDKNAPIPEFANIRDIRNAMEHGWLQVRKRKCDESISKRGNFPYIITPQELEYYTLSTLKLVRAAILYLTMAVTYNEKNERKKK